MPILHFHLAEGLYSDTQQERLLIESSQLFARELACPIDRVRAFIHLYAPQRVAVGGELVSRRDGDAPYFQFVSLEGRPLEQRQRLLRGFTDLLVEILGVPRERVRGGCWPVASENWAIAGVPASVVRATEIASRAVAAAAPGPAPALP